MKVCILGEMRSERVTLYNTKNKKHKHTNPLATY